MQRSSNIRSCCVLAGNKSWNTPPLSQKEGQTKSTCIPWWAGSVWRGLVPSDSQHLPGRIQFCDKRSSHYWDPVWRAVKTFHCRASSNTDPPHQVPSQVTKQAGTASGNLGLVSKESPRIKVWEQFLVAQQLYRPSCVLIFFFSFLFVCLSHPRYEHTKLTESQPNQTIHNQTKLILTRLNQTQPNQTNSSKPN